MSFTIVEGYVVITTEITSRMGSVNTTDLSGALVGLDMGFGSGIITKIMVRRTAGQGLERFFVKVYDDPIQSATGQVLDLSAENTDRLELLCNPSVPFSNSSGNFLYIRVIPDLTGNHSFQVRMFCTKALSS